MSYTYNYPRPSVTADVILIANFPASPEVLLIQRRDVPYKNAWAFPGGFMDIDETIETAAARELEEETGLKGLDLKQFYVASKVDRDPRHRVISVIFTTLVNSKEEVKPKAGDDAKSVKWFPLSNLPQLAFDHSEIIEQLKTAIAQGRFQ